jgi:hypothetical protein
MRHECAHQGCHCPVSDTNQFCSDLCRAAVGATAGVADAFNMPVCRCGHPACLEHAEGKQIH